MDRVDRLGVAGNHWLEIYDGVRGSDADAFLSMPNPFPVHRHELQTAAYPHMHSGALGMDFWQGWIPRPRPRPISFLGS
jgi:hypothetical protein